MGRETKADKWGKQPFQAVSKLHGTRGKGQERCEQDQKQQAQSHVGSHDKSLSRNPDKAGLQKRFSFGEKNMDRCSEKHKDEDRLRRPQDKPEGKTGRCGNASEKDTPQGEYCGVLYHKYAGKQDQDGYDLASWVQGMDN